MPADTQILKEYLLSLGFRVDEKSSKTLDTSVKKLDFSAGKLFGSLVGVATAAQAMAVAFARSMERLYYSSEKSGAAVGNLQAFAYAEKQIGLASGTMQSALEGMARAMRDNPGLTELVEWFGIPVKGRDMADVAVDFVKVLGKMDHFVGSKFAGMFGIDSDTLFLLTKHVDEFERAAAARKKMADAAGVDTKAAAEAGKEYAHMLNEILELFGLLKDVVSIALLPAMKDMAAVVRDALKSLTSIIKDATERGFLKQVNGVAEQVVYHWKDVTQGQTLGGIGKKLWEGLFGSDRQGVTLSKESAARLGVPTAAPILPKGADGNAGAPQTSASLFDRLEKAYGLPSGLLDKMWAKESGRGKNMLSPVGAKGHFQFMDATAAQYGLKDPNDLVQAATAASKYMADLLKMYGGDLQKALAGYNWGPGNVNKHGLANAPWETRDYVATISGRPIQINNNTEIKVSGPDPVTTANLVARAQVQVANDTARYQGAVGVR